MVRPQRGSWWRSSRREAVDIIFILGDAPDTFEPRLADGGPIEFEPGDNITVDVLGPGQAISLPMREQA